LDIWTFKTHLKYLNLYYLLVYIFKDNHLLYLMYNTQFKVKYNDIETELIEKLNNTETTEYNLEDVSDICSKLYRDELMSVFDVHFILDDRIDKGMKNVYEIMIANSNFKQFAYDLENTYLQEFIQSQNKREADQTEAAEADQEKRFKQLLLMILFSQDIFYIMHKCICQQIELNIINDDLLVTLKQKCIETLLSLKNI